MRIAAVAVDVSLPHLDRTFDYRVPDHLAVEVGQRVRVRFAGRLVTGFIIYLHDDASHATQDLRALASTSIVLAPAQAALVRAVADRYASTFADVVRFAVPPRHAQAESSALIAPLPTPSGGTELEEPLLAVRALPAFLDRAARGESVAAVLELPSAVDLAASIAMLAHCALGSGPVVVIAPDARDVERIRIALLARGVTPIVMQAGVGPSARQRAFTFASRADGHVVVGTRTAVFAPVQGRGITIVVSDGSDALVEQQTPGWHAREVALLRNSTQGWSALFVGRHRSLELQALVASGVVKELRWPTEQWRALSVRVEAVPERLDGADPLLRRLRIPPSVFRAAREALAHGPVVMSVAQRGYITSVRCATCREAARCSECSGPMGIAAAGELPRCRLCGRTGWQCPWCEGTHVRHSGIGSERTREELGRAFPNVPVRIVDAEHPLPMLPTESQLLLVTPGSEPDGRAALAVILDADAVLGRHDLSASVESVRRWFEVAALVQSGGRLLVVGTSTAPAIQALVRSDPSGFAAHELRERAAVSLPPALHAAVVQAPPGNSAATEIAGAVPGCTMLGPVVVDEVQRWLILHEQLAPLTSAVRAVLATRSASKTLAGVGVRIDPLELAT